MKFVRQVGDDYSLIEKPGGDCIFWDKVAGCTVYPARPAQCQTWPFWPEPGVARRLGSSRGKLPGSGHGRLYTIEEIKASVARVAP